MNSQAAADLVGISYRQIDHWVRCGYVKGGTPGTGHARDISDAEVLVLWYLAALVNSGVQVLMAAAVARRLAEGETVPFAFWHLDPNQSSLDIQEAQPA